MKKAGLLIILILVGFVFLGCMGGPAPKETPEEEAKEAEAEKPEEPMVKRPDVLDHKNYKWGKDVPDWVTMEVSELEEMEKYQDVYLFKFESPRAQDLQGAKLWTQNFTAQSEITRAIQNRVQTKFAGAAAGDTDMIETYMEQTVKTLSDANITGFKKVDDYWVQMRYYKPDGTVDEDAYTYSVLYKMDKGVLDELIQKALEEAGQEVKPKSEEEKRVRNLVQEDFSGGL